MKTRHFLEKENFHQGNKKDVQYYWNLHRNYCFIFFIEFNFSLTLRTKNPFDFDIIVFVFQYCLSKIPLKIPFQFNVYTIQLAMDFNRFNFIFNCIICSFFLHPFIHLCDYFGYVFVEWELISIYETAFCLQFER